MIWRNLCVFLVFDSIGACFFRVAISNWKCITMASSEWLPWWKSTPPSPMASWVKSEQVVAEPEMASQAQGG